MRANLTTRAFLLLPALLFCLTLPKPAMAVTANRIWRAVTEQASDYYGYSAAGNFDLNGDGYPDIAVGAWLFDAGGLGNQGKIYVYYGGPAGDDVADLTLLGSEQDYLGSSIAPAGDVNNDGFDDLIVGATETGTSPGRAYILLGGATPNNVVDVSMIGENNDDTFGECVAGVGDINGDGYDDWMVGATRYDGVETSVGRAYVYLGGSTPNNVADLTLTGDRNGELGDMVAGAGDVNGDGYDDFMVGAPLRDQLGESVGRASLYFGGATLNGTADVIFDGQREFATFGRVGDGIGDVNGDGYGDVAVGSYYDSPNGQGSGGVSVFYGGSPMDAVPDLMLVGDEEDYFGSSVSAAGDVDGDGYDDFLVGAYKGGAGGEVKLFLGGPSTDATADLVIDGETLAPEIGWIVAGAGDLNGDGTPDLLATSWLGTAHLYTLHPYRLLGPTGGEQWVIGRPATVRWLGSELTDIAVSHDAGATWLTVAEDVGGGVTNAFDVIAPGPDSDRALVRLRMAGAVISPTSIRVSPAPFRIVEPHDPPAASHRLEMTLPGQALGDQFGQALATGDWNGDGRVDVAVGASGNDAVASGAGRAYVYFGGPVFDGAADVILSGAVTSDAFGRSLGNAGDVNGDGHDDLIVSVGGSDVAFTNGGAAQVFFGGPSFDAVADWTLLGEAASDAFGDAACGAGDVNGDGYGDVLVTADSNDAGGTSAGAAYIYFGGTAPDAVYDLRLLGAASADFLGGSGAGLGDINGDGYDDWGVGAAGNDAGGSTAGRAYICLGGANPNAVPDLVLTGETAGDNLGSRIAPAGDVNGDGYDDLLVGAPLNDAAGSSAGRAYLHFGGPILDDRPDLIVSGIAAGENVGFGLRGAGDVNGDGFDDLLLSAYASSFSAASGGRVMLFYGGPGLDDAPDGEYRGTLASMFLGYDVCGTGDLNGDGFGDFLIGAPQTTVTGNGQVQVFDGRRFHFELPNGGATWNVGATETIAWSGAEPADLWLSVDGGNSYALLEDNVGGAAENTLRLLVPHQPTRFARLRLMPADAAVFGNAETDSLFTIEASIALLNLKAEPVPNGGGIQLSWETNPGPADLAGYRIERAVRGGGSGPGGPGSGGESGNGAPAWTTLIPLTRSTTYIDISGTPGARYRLSGINGLGQDIVLGEIATTPAAALAAWPLPYRGGALAVSFLTAGGLGGAPGPATVALFDVAGRRVRTLAAGDFAAGTAEAAWDGTDDHGRPVASGLYFLRATTGSSDSKLKVVVVR